MARDSIERAIQQFANGIYTKWHVYMHTILDPVKKKGCLYEKIQNGIRNNIERAFGVLQGKWHTFSHASRFMTMDPCVGFLAPLCEA